MTVELVTNGGFQDGSTGWTGADTAIASYYAVDVATAGDPWAVNLSQVMTLVAGTDYEVSFKARASVARTMIAGLGLNAGPWSAATETVDLTTDWQTFTYTINTTDVSNGAFGDDNSRVLFDMGANVGAVHIDDVSVKLTGGDGAELLTNGDFQAGSASWANADTAIASYYDVHVETAGDAYAVNLSQTMTLVPDTAYTVSFKAKASVARTMLAGLGLYHDPWTNVAESVSLTTEWQTFTLNQTTTGFGDDNSRVLFDMGAEVGAVSIDDVSVTTESVDPVDPEAGDLGTGDNNVLNAGEVINFNSTTVGIYALDDFGNNVSTLVADPTDATNTVLSIIKGNETWAGTTIARGSVIYPLTATETIITARVWSPEAGITVRLKLEESGDNTHTVETDAVTTKAQEWETLTFDFSNPATNDGNPTNPLNVEYVFDTLSVFMNFGSAGSSETYYFDDVTFVGAAPVVASTVTAADLVGDWKLAPHAGSLAVGESADNLGWWSSDEATATTRACLFDDVYTFGSDGSFSQAMGTETWVEAWQGTDPEGCAAPVAPHDGSYTDGTYSVADSKVTVNGLGAHLGLPKVTGSGEISDTANAVSTITYNVTELSADGNHMTVQIQYNGANTWQFMFVKA